jgi:7-carboxy-7-deazaguanine synthase
MGYAVKEIFFTLQGEGAHAGRPAVFCRFAGCNLWTGKEEDRGKAICQFCDTDFRGTNGTGGGTYSTAEQLAETIAENWPSNASRKNARKKLAVCTGGEPLLQLDTELVNSLHQRGFEIAVETNGTRPAPEGLDWICVSPKANAPLILRSGDELKLVFPQEGNNPDDFADLDFSRFFLQPMDGDSRDENTRLAVQYCLQNPQWELSLQIHKLVGLP